MTIQYDLLLSCYWAFFGDSRTSINGNWSWETKSELEFDLDACNLELIGNEVVSIN